MEKFDYCKINFCFGLIKPVNKRLGTNAVAVLLLQTLERNQSYLYEKQRRVFSCNNFLSIKNTAVNSLQVDTGHCFFVDRSNWNGSKTTVAQLV